MTTAVVNFDSLFERRVGLPPLTVAVTSWNGMTGDVVGTLANIWTYGQTHPSNLLTNYFPMDSGNYRFTGSANSGALPATGFFESNAGGNPGGDSRVGTDYFRRYYRTALGAGGSVFDEFVCYDPLWNGAFTGTGAVQHTTQKIGFSDGSGAQDQPNVGLTMGLEVWAAVQGFFDGPLTYPTPGFNTGAREDVTWALFNGNANTTETRGYLNGWGQFVALTQPNQNGKWTGYDIQIDPSYAPAGVAGDGAGLTVRYGRGSPAPDPPKGGIFCTMTDGNFAHGWGWDFLASASAGQLTKIARLDWDGGFALQVPITSAGAPLVATYTTPLVDFTIPNQFVDLNTPLQAGKLFVAMVGRLILITRNATVTSGPTINIAQNGADLATPAITPAAFNSVPAPNETSALPVTVGMPDMTTHPLQLHLTTAAAGAGLTSCTGYYQVAGIYI